MKGKRFLSILVTVVILTMLMVAIPVTPALAAGVSLDPTIGEIGDDVDINGTAFEDNATVYFYFSDESASVGEEIDTDVLNYEVVLETESNGDGEVSDSFSVPDELTNGEDTEDVNDGTYYVYSTYDDNEIVTKDTFNVGGGGTGDESISVLPTSGEIDDYVEIEGTDFEEDATVDFYFSGESASVGEEIDSDVNNYELVEEVDAESNGDVSGYFYVPDTLTDGDEDEDVDGGTYYVYATYEGNDEILAKDTFTVSVVKLSVSPIKGTVGTKVTITGSGFADNKSITIKFGGSTVEIDDGNEVTSGSGAFTSYILVPETAKGSYTITVTVGSDTTTAEDKFTVEPNITISPEEGGINDRVTVTGTGFAENEDITITFDGDEVATGETDSYGSFETTFNVPEVTSGTYKVEADTAEASFTISTSVNVSPTTSVNSPGHVGEDVTISGTGFKANSEIEITFASTPVVVATVTSEADGSFEAIFKVPASKAGEHTITASDGTSSMSAKFYMESTAPATPPPLQPYMEGKAGSRTYFDWEDVTTDIDGVVEPSLPITYELQIATDADFANLLLDKTGITTSEYTLTEEEALESTGKDAPYYWRLRAVDAASNASPWTGVGQFRVGFTFNLPNMGGWLLYVLIGVGALVLFFVGFWLGRRGGGGGGDSY